MKLQLNVEVEVPEDTSLVEAHDIVHDLVEHIDRFRSDLNIAKDTQVRVDSKLKIDL